MTQSSVRARLAKLQDLFSKKTVRATAWITSAMALQKAIQFVSNLILTRLLFPEAFGVMTLCWTIMTGLGMLSDVGLRPAILNSARGHEPDFMNTAWTIQQLRGTFMFVGAAACAYPLALLYGQPELTFLLVLVSTTSAFQTMRPITLIVAERDMRVHFEIIVETVSQVLTLIITAAFAFWLRSAYALAYGAVCGGLISLTLAWIIAPRHRHRFMLEPSALHEIKGFSGWIFLSTAFTFMGNQGSRLIQGVVLSAAQLGILSVAQAIASIPSEFAQRIANGVALPKIAQVYRDLPEDHPHITRRLHARYALFLAASYLPLWGIAPYAIRFLYDARYWQAGHMLQLLCVNAMATNLRAIYTSAFLATGHPKLSFHVQCAAALTNALGIAIGYHFGGVVGMINGMTAGAFVTYLVVALESARHHALDLKTDVLFWGLTAGLMAISR